MHVANPKPDPKPAPKFNIRVMPRSKEELANPDFMLDLALAKMNQFDEETGMPPTDANQRKMFLRDITTNPRERWVEKIGEWVYIIPSWEMGKITDPKAKPKMAKCKTGKAAAKAQANATMQTKPPVSGEDQGEGEGQ
jgi:hypothetical protein